MEMAVTTEAGGSGGGGGGGGGGPMDIAVNKGLTCVTNKLEPPLEIACKVGVK
jgi:hypothetical protein